MSKDIAIFVIAENIENETINRFKCCLELSSPKYKYDIYINKGQKRNKDDQFENFNKSRLLNETLKNILNKDYNVVIQTDVDIITPPNMIDYAYEIALSGKICWHNEMVRISPESDINFKNLPSSYNKIDWEKYSEIMNKRWIDAAGCFNCMQSKHWKETYGWAEEMKAHGREDDLHHEMIKKCTDIELIKSHKFPLLHYDHPPRTKDNRRYNDRVRNEYRKQGFKNWI